MSLLFTESDTYPHEESLGGGSGPAAPAAAGPYLTYDVLDVRHDLRESIAESFARRGQLVAGATGPRVYDDHAGVAFPTRSFLWTANDRTACSSVRSFLDARKGRLVPFWVPTCCHDLRLATDASDAASTLLIRRAGYLDFLFGQPGRRYLAIFPPGGSMVLRKVITGSPVDQATEQLGLDASLGVALPAEGTVISFLVFCRLAEDLTRLQWFSTWGCEATIRFVELPLEVPA